MVLGPLSTLYPESGKRSPIVVIAGHGGRAKTAQLYQMFAGYAAKVTRDGPLPLFARLNDFEPSDVSRRHAATPVGRHSRSIRLLTGYPSRSSCSSTATRMSIIESASARSNGSKSWRKPRPGASFVITLDQHLLDQIPGLTSAEAIAQVLLVQLLTPSTVAQYLNQLKDGTGKALRSRWNEPQRGRLEDLACE
jgi:hypothetical protein